MPRKSRPGGRRWPRRGRSWRGGAWERQPSSGSADFTQPPRRTSRERAHACCRRLARETAKIVFDPLVSTCWHRDRCVRKAKAMKLPTAPEVAAFMLIVGSFVMGKEAHSNRQTQPMSSCFESRALSLDSILQDGSPCGASYSPRVTSSVRCVGYHRSLRRSLDAVRVCSAAATKSTRPFSCTTLHTVRLLASVHGSPFTGVLRMPA